MTPRRHLLALLAAAPFALPRIGRAQAEITKAQPKLPEEKLVIVTQDGRHHEFTVEMATTPDEQETGLMFRASVAPDGGMLFDWGGVRPSQMWMKNTVASLDMVFIGADNRIARIAENTVPFSLAVIDGGDARATLELAAGITARLNIRVGDKVLAKSLGNLS
jgi:uncharacterized membrane protein (UPF0127 family)